MLGSLVLAGIGCALMSNPRRKRRKARRVAKRNPGGTAPDGWRYNLKDSREWNEFQIIARTPAGKVHEGRKQFFPYSSGDAANKREVRAEAEAALKKMIATGSLLSNPRRKSKGKRSSRRSGVSPGGAASRLAHWRWHHNPRNGATKISKKDYYALGGMANGDLFRKANKRGVWSYYKANRSYHNPRKARRK